MIYFVTAERNSGKTTYLEKLVLKNPKAFGGILSIAGPNKDSYYAKDVETGQMHLLMEVSNDPTIGKYHCHQDVFEWAKEIIKTSEKKKIIIDEVGRLELQDQGFASVLRGLDSSKDYYIAVRTQFVDDVIKHFNIAKYTKLCP